MVERNLAKVEVGSSRLLSRSRIPGDNEDRRGGWRLRYPLLIDSSGGVAEWSCSGLQSRVRRFDSDPRLQDTAARAEAFDINVHAQIGTVAARVA